MVASKDINDPNAFVFYRYEPSLAAAAIFTVLFGLTTLLHIFQMIRKRAWFLIPLVIGGFFEFIGYIGRIQSSQDQWAKGPFILQTLLLLLGPTLFAASIYMILARVIILTDGQPYSLVRPNWLTAIFVMGDIISFSLQGAGGGVMSMGGGSGNNKNSKRIVSARATAEEIKKNRKLGENIIVGGLFVQILFFSLFVIVAALFQIRGKAHLARVQATIPWRKYMYVLYGTSVLILVRSVFRVIEYIQGNAGYLLRHEVYLYIFDALLMFAVMVALNFVHPGDIADMLKKKNKQEGKTAVADSSSYTMA